MIKLYKIRPRRIGYGLGIHWQHDIYFNRVYFPMLKNIINQHVGKAMTAGNREFANLDLENFFSDIKDNMYINEKDVPYSPNPYVLLKKGEEEIYSYVAAMAMPVMKGETMSKKEMPLLSRVTHVEKKLDRLCKHIGKLTNELKKADKVNENKSSKTRTLNDLPEIKLDFDSLLQAGSNERGCHGYKTRYDYIEAARRQMNAYIKTDSKTLRDVAGITGITLTFEEIKEDDIELGEQLNYLQKQLNEIRAKLLKKRGLR